MGNDFYRRRRRRVAWGLAAVAVLLAVWFLLPPIPVIWGPTASAATKAAGRELFIHDWQPGDPLAGGDGLGPVFNARSCVACHFQGGTGGGGSNHFNVTTFEVFPTSSNGTVRQGVVHTGAVKPAFRESQEALRKFFPIISKGTILEPDGNCGSRAVPIDVDPLKTEKVNTTALYGAGWIDYISDSSIKYNQVRRSLANCAREFDLNFDNIPAGRPRVLADGRIGKFGWKAQFATLEEFVAAACANELGLGNPLMPQATPFWQPAPQTVSPDLDRKQFHQLVAFVKTLPKPVEAVPDDEALSEHANRGKAVFKGIGCAVCHTPDFGGVSGIYSDLMLHSLTDPRGSNGGYGSLDPQLVIPENHPDPDEWKTPPLWGVADSAPYFHDGQSATLRDAILRHQGGAAVVTQRYRSLSKSDQEALIAFLKTLRAPPDAEPAPPSLMARR